jgi:DNA-binding transcriptional MerR regulator
MTSLTTEEFPYTIGYVMELLGIDERELLTSVQILGLTPSKDERTGRLIFNHRDIEALKKATEMKKQGDSPDAIVRQMAYQPSSSVGQKKMSNAAEKPVYLPPAKDNISVMVEAVSQVKEGILKDLSRLLDDKLSGLDEVVVELIRCKSENDALKKKLDDALLSKQGLEEELGRFKPVQFGFYRKC